MHIGTGKNQNDIKNDSLIIVNYVVHEMFSEWNK